MRVQDAIRVVNALLTHIDQLKARENVLILTTSNISEAIDLAFVDRADIKQYIGPPILSARFAILRSCVSELMRVGIVAPPVHLLGFDAAQKAAAELSRSPSHLAACEGGSGAGAGGMIGNGSGDAMASARGGGSSGGCSKELRHLEQCPSAMLLRAAALTDGFSGAVLAFCGRQGEPGHRALSLQYGHELGRCVVHAGRRRHGAKDIRGGVRENLIVWTRSVVHRDSAAFSNPAYHREAGPPSAECLSFTHDRDFGEHKAYPPGKEALSGRAWCPPDFARHDAVDAPRTCPPSPPPQRQQQQQQQQQQRRRPKKLRRRRPPPSGRSAPGGGGGAGPQ